MLIRCNFLSYQLYFNPPFLFFREYIMHAHTLLCKRIVFGMPTMRGKIMPNNTIGNKGPSLPERHIVHAPQYNVLPFLTERPGRLSLVFDRPKIT